MRLTQTLRYLSSHPLTRDRKLAAYWRFIKWQAGTRLFPFPVLYPFVAGTSLLVRKGMAGATGNIYAGLHEFSEMGFLLHLLRPEDLFGDIGANIGAFSVLASGVAGAGSISAEPVLSTFLHFKNNVAVNDLESKVQLHNCGVGAEPGKLYFTRDLDTINHVAVEGEMNSKEVDAVDIITLDQLFPSRAPVLLKIDVEGFEMSVLQGAKRLLNESGLKAIIIELNGACGRYGIKEEDIHQLLLSYGFRPMSYLPLDRKLESLVTFDPHGNTIYIRDEAWVKERLNSAKKRNILNKVF